MNSELLETIKELKTAIEDKQVGDMNKALLEIQKLPLIVQYYSLKGLKLADKPLFYKMADLDRTIIYPMMIKLLSDIYDYETYGKDYDAAYKGLGNIDEYVVAIKGL